MHERAAQELQCLAGAVLVPCMHACMHASVSGAIRAAMQCGAAAPDAVPRMRACARRPGQHGARAEHRGALRRQQMVRADRAQPAVGPVLLAARHAQGGGAGAVLIRTCSAYSAYCRLLHAARPDQAADFQAALRLLFPWRSSAACGCMRGVARLCWPHPARGEPCNPCCMQCCPRQAAAIQQQFTQHGTAMHVSMVHLYLQVKMVTSDDEATTDILCEGPEEEIERLRKEFGLAEKGKVLVKGLLER